MVQKKEINYLFGIYSLFLTSLLCYSPITKMTYLNQYFKNLTVNQHEITSKKIIVIFKIFIL